MTMHCTDGELYDAVGMLLRGYEEELSLYGTVRALTTEQKTILKNGRKMQRFCDLLDEKEDILNLIGQMEKSMRPARSMVMSVDPEECPDRHRLATLLDRLTRTIEETRSLEIENAKLLLSIPTDSNSAETEAKRTASISSRKVVAEHRAI